MRRSGGSAECADGAPALPGWGLRAPGLTRPLTSSHLRRGRRGGRESRMNLRARRATVLLVLVAAAATGCGPTAPPAGGAPPPRRPPPPPPPPPPPRPP